MWKSLVSAVPVVEAVENFVKGATGESRVYLGSTGSLWPLAAAVYLEVHQTAVFDQTLMSAEKECAPHKTCTDTNILFERGGHVVEVNHPCTWSSSADAGTRVQ